MSRNGPVPGSQIVSFCSFSFFSCLSRWVFQGGDTLFLIADGSVQFRDLLVFLGHGGFQLIDGTQQLFLPFPGSGELVVQGFQGLSHGCKLTGKRVPFWSRSAVFH